MTQKRQYDWVAIKKDYRTGKFESDRALCRYWQIPESTLRTRKKGSVKTGEKPWKKDLVKDFHSELENQSIQQLAQRDAQSAEMRANDEDTVESAAKAAIGVIQVHLKKIGDLSLVSDKLTEKLLNALIDDETEELVKWSLGKQESTADIIVKLAKALTDLIRLQRQALNLDALISRDPVSEARDLVEERRLKLMEESGFKSS